MKYDNPDFEKLSGVKKYNSIEQLRPMNGWIYIFGENSVLLHALMAGKWFAETDFDAAQWGRLFYQWSATPFYVIQADLPDWVTAQMFRVANLDNIGPARWASEGDLLGASQLCKLGVVDSNPLR